MKPTLILVVLISAALAAGCTDKATATQAAQDDAAARARAEALKKEMDAAPKTFTNRDIFKKNEPAKQTDTKPAGSAEKKP